METVNLKEFGPIISDRETGFKIYNLIKAKNPYSTIVNIDMDGNQFLNLVFICVPIVDFDTLLSE